MVSPESKAQYIQRVTNAKLTVSGTTSLETIYTAPTGTDFDFAIVESILVCDHGNQQTNIDISISTGASTYHCLLYTSPSPRDGLLSRMPSSA